MRARRIGTTVVIVIGAIASILGIIVDAPEAISQLWRGLEMRPSPNLIWVLGIAIAAGIALCFVWLPRSKSVPLDIASALRAVESVYRDWTETVSKMHRDPETRSKSRDKLHQESWFVRSIEILKIHHPELGEQITSLAQKHKDVTRWQEAIWSATRLVELERERLHAIQAAQALNASRN